MCVYAHLEWSCWGGGLPVPLLVLVSLFTNTKNLLFFFLKLSGTLFLIRRLSSVPLPMLQAWQQFWWPTLWMWCAHELPFRWKQPPWRWGWGRWSDWCVRQRVGWDLSIVAWSRLWLAWHPTQVGAWKRHHFYRDVFLSLLLLFWGRQLLRSSAQSLVFCWQKHWMGIYLLSKIQWNPSKAKSNWWNGFCFIQVMVWNNYHDLYRCIMVSESLVISSNTWPCPFCHQHSLLLPHLVICFVPWIACTQNERVL